MARVRKRRWQLDRRAVVVTGLPAWEEASLDEYAAKTFVQGVTRARQLLAVVTRGGRGDGGTG